LSGRQRPAYGCTIEYATLFYTVGDDGIATGTINRPDRLNVLNGEVIASLGQSAYAVEGDKSARATPAIYFELDVYNLLIVRPLLASVVTRFAQ